MAVRTSVSQGLLFALAALPLHSAGAAHMDPAVKRGLQTFDHSKKEVCVVPEMFPGLNPNEPTQSQLDLCSLDLHEDEKIAVCPKGNSTNPGLLIFGELPVGVSKADFEAKHCLLPEEKQGGDKLAKFKSSITCSYAPGILAYYQISKLLGGAGNVPASVIRTFDLATHKAIAKMGQKTAIGKMWVQFSNSDAAPAKFPNLYTKDLSQLYGAFSVNPSGEEFYAEFFGPKHPYEKGLWAFLQTAAYKSVANPKPMSAQVGSTLAEAAQTITAAKDASDMILMDTLLNQQDRFGNVHYKTAYLYVEDGEIKRGGRKSDPAEMKAKGAVQIKELLMKDNDCSVSKSNKMKAGKVLETVRHMSPKTYQRFLRLALTIGNPEVKEYFQRELLFNAEDLKSVEANIKAALTTLQGACKKKTLLLDLDLETHLGLKTLAAPGTDLCALQPEEVAQPAAAVSLPAQP